jgi:CMP-N-acetylneuraminic acid synthetase
MNRKVLAVIAARGGSKRLPGKNIRLLGGKPLIAWTIEAAKKARNLTRVLLSTDCAAIAEVARTHEIEIPFLRPAALATDTARPIDVLKHALDYCFDQGEQYDAVIFLQATSPFRTAVHIEQAMALFFDTRADTVTSVCPVAEHAYYQVSLQGNVLVPFFPKGYEKNRHELPPAVIENGAVYVLSPEHIREDRFYGDLVVGYVMERRESVDIDTEEDFHWAEFLIGLHKPKENI